VECRYGRWYSDTPVTLPSCKPVVCNPPAVENGRLLNGGGGDGARSRSGEEASVICDEGYERTRSSAAHGRVVCQADGTWQSADSAFAFPECREKHCDFPDERIPHVANGTLEIDGRRVISADENEKERDVTEKTSYRPGSVAVFTCNAGLVMVPLSAGKLVCRRGRWEGNLPACGKTSFSPSLGLIDLLLISQ